MPSSRPQPQLQAEGQGIAIPLPQATQLLTSFTHFFTVAIHNILYYRSLYPQTTFLSTQAYNLAVHQSRHPAVCGWVQDAVDAVKAQLVMGTVSRIAIVIHDHDTQVRERWMLDVGSFPAWPEFDEARSARDEVVEEDDGAPSRAGPQRSAPAVNWSDVDEGLRAALWKMAIASDKMAPLPDGCSFTIALELREASEAPIGVSTSLWRTVAPGRGLTRNLSGSTHNLGYLHSRGLHLGRRSDGKVAVPLTVPRRSRSGRSRQALCSLSAGSRKGRIWRGRPMHPPEQLGICFALRSLLPVFLGW